jgi:hypothetical protein
MDERGLVGREGNRCMAGSGKRGLRWDHMNGPGLGRQVVASTADNLPGASTDSIM